MVQFIFPLYIGGINHDYRYRLAVISGAFMKWTLIRLGQFVTVSVHYRTSGCYTYNIELKLSY